MRAASSPATAVAVGLLTFTTIAASASAQTLIAPAPLRPSTRPTVSPFLALNERRQATGQLNLFRNVRPQQQLFRQTQQQNRELRQLSSALETARNERASLATQLEQRQIDDATAVTATGTGHTSFRFNTGNYFPTGRMAGSLAQPPRR